jgi:hypothetical protein
MIKELSRAFNALVDSLSAKPLATIMALCILFVGYVSYTNHDAIQALIVTPSQEAERFEKQLTSAEITNQAIEGLRADLSADNIAIRQFHNGRHDLTGIPFTSIETTFYTELEVTGEHEEVPIDEPVSANNKLLRLMWKRIDKPECVVLDIPVDHSTRVYFREHKLRRIAACPLVNLLNYPIGIMIVGLSEGNTKSNEEILQKTSVIAKRVTGYLNNGY